MKAALFTAQALMLILAVLLLATCSEFNGDGQRNIDSSHALSFAYYRMGLPDGASGPNSLIVGDFNGDSKLDLATANASNSVSVLLGYGDGNFRAGVNSAAGDAPHSVVMGDFNGDLKHDLAVVNSMDFTKTRQGGISILTGTGDGSFGLQTAATFSLGGTSGAWAISATPGDFDGDSRLDLAVIMNFSAVGSHFRSQWVSLLLQNSDGSFLEASNFKKTGTYDVAEGVIAKDFNRDGKLDLAVITNSSYVSVALGSGAGSFQAAGNVETGYERCAVVIGDFNADSKLDIVAVGGDARAGDDYLEGSLVANLGNGDGSFQPATIYSAGLTQCSAATAGDFNGDSKPDLAVANYDGNITILLGNGDGSFQLAVNFAGASQPRALAIGDFNGDSKLDLAVVNNDIDDISLLINTTASPVEPTAADSR